MVGPQIRRRISGRTMTHQLSKSQKAIQKTAMEFARGEFDKDAACEFDRRAEFPQKIWKKAGELGFIGIHLPEKLGGGGMGRLENVLVAETLAARDSTTAAALMLAGMAAEWLARFGSPAQQATLLPEILEGRTRPGTLLGPVVDGMPDNSLCLNEAGPDAAWCLDGELAGVINGTNADVLFLLCRDNTARQAPAACSMLMLEGGQPGMHSGNEAPMLGLRMTGMARIRCDGARVTPANLIGRQARGLEQAASLLPELHLLLAALALGTAQGAFERGLAHVKEREQFGRKLAEFQVTRQKLAEMALCIEQVRSLTYRVAIYSDPEKIEPRMAAMANLAATRTAVNVSYESIQLLGGYGFTTEYDVERCYRDAKTLQIISGHKNDLTETIATAVIGRLKR